MKLFLSWSGERSHQVAELFKGWIQVVIQSIDPWLSSENIDKGSIWFQQITEELKKTENGIFFLTKSNLNKPWILFEAGAISKGENNNGIFTFLIDLTSEQIQPPLSLFNNVKFDKDDILNLLKTLNKKTKRELPNHILINAFEANWKSFEEDFQKIIKNTKSENVKMTRGNDDILSEVLSTVRSLDKFMSTINNNYKIVELGSRLINNRQLPISWEKNSYTLNEKSKQVLENDLLPILKAYHKVVIESHTNTLGDETSNLIITERRAKSIKKFFVEEHKISPDLIEAFGYGCKKLVNKCVKGVKCTEREHKANIRTTYRIVGDYVDLDL